MSELLVALAMAAALGAKPAPAQADPQHARSRPSATAPSETVASTQALKPKDNRRAIAPSRL
jgi:hypothetical protein